MGEDHTYRMEGICTILIRMFDGIVRKFKDVRNIPQLKKNLISIGALKAQGIKGTLGDDALKILKSSMVILKGVRRNNLYYLKDSALTGQVAVLEGVDDSTRLWHMKLGHTVEKSLQALVK